MTRFAIAALLSAATALPAAVAAQDDPFLSVRESDEWGRYLAGPKGKPVYAFATQMRGGDDLSPLKSCGPRCREIWPLVTLPYEADPQVAEGLDPEKATYVTWEGEPVATYDGRALFHYAREDESPEPDGHGIHTHGGWWVLISPKGALLHDGIIPDPENY